MFAAAAAFTACEKNDGPALEQDNRMKSASIKLLNVQMPTRSADGEIADQTQVQLNDFQVFFVGSDGLLYLGKKLNSTGVAPELENGEETVYDPHFFQFTPGNTDGTYNNGTNDALVYHKQATYHFLPNVVNKVVILGNIDTEIEVKYGETTLESLKNEAIAIASQQNNEDLLLYAESGLTKVTDPAMDGVGTHELPLYKAELNLKPLVSRFEIVGFKYALETGKTTREYDKITVEQIFFNDWYQTASNFGGQVNGIVAHKDVAPAAVLETLNSLTPAWYNDYLTVDYTADYMKTATTGLGSVVLSGATQEADTWGHVFSAVEAESALSPVYNFFSVGMQTEPQIVVRLRAEKGNDIFPIYLTTSKFMEVEGGNDVVDTNVAKVYKVHFVFDDGNIRSPEKCVDVYVSVAEWQVVDVIPEF